MSTPTSDSKENPETWIDFLAPYEGLVEVNFLNRWGARRWQPTEDDTRAASKLHMQFASRITTRHLGYLDGVEQRALDSVYEMFKETRTICDAYPLARHFDALAWHVMNTHVRPFTAKWHRESQRGALRALDTTDEFRAELSELQPVLIRFTDLLLHLRDGTPPPPRPTATDSGRAKEISAEMERPLAWGIPARLGGPDEQVREEMNDAERTAILARRQHYDPSQTKGHATALALSGGGIRSATFSLGVLVALARRGILPRFDYLSTVSGGGYLGSFLTTYLNSPADTAPPVGLRRDELPFKHDVGEAEALRHIRHHSKYLAAGSFPDRLRMIGAQLYGMALNGLGVVMLAAIFALAERYLRSLDLDVMFLVRNLGLVFAGWAIVSLFLIRIGRKCQRIADSGLILVGGLLVALLVWIGLGYCHKWIDQRPEWVMDSEIPTTVILGAIPVIASAFAGIAGKIFGRVKMVLGLLSVFAAPLFFFCIYLAIYQWSGRSAEAVSFSGYSLTWLQLLTIILAVVCFWLLDINFTSPHRHYRNKLAEAYLIQPAKNPGPGRPFDDAVDLKLSAIGSTTHRGPYHLINAALNVPGSTDPAMQGRLTEFFLFSPAFCGSPLTGYQPTARWENKDPHLDLGTAMAISGAAAAPLMGLGTKRRLSFWYALLNIRLGYWVRNPGKGAGSFGGAPGLWFLLKEMRGSMDEHSPWLYLSDGGHLENLGVYELLRRRCKFIVAVDGEQDERMTFGALTTLQRLAKIDLDTTIDIELDDLRLDEKGFSRSHFRFCRIEYPGKQFGYLLYIKLSLTGNEGEFLRRYRMDEPVFPHHSTNDQFFSETQFEAYRSLGEHVGDKLFLRALVGDELSQSNDINIEEWFAELGKRLLEPPRNHG